MPFEIDCDDPEVRICACCGHENLDLFRTIHDGENVVAVYLVSLPAHAGFPVSVFLTVGCLEDDASKADRFAMTFQIVSQPDRYGTILTEPADAGWDESDLATLLSREEALARFSKEIFAFSDLIITNDHVIRSYLDASLTHGLGPTRH